MRVTAIDQGTTSTRAFVLDERGDGSIVHSCTHQQYYPKTGWVEHDPEELLANIKRCLDAAGAVDAIAIANQGESCLAWDRDSKEAISPVIVWQDRRTESVVSRLKKEGAEALTLSKAGLPLDAYFSGSKLGWIVKNIPAAKILLDQGRLRLGTTDAFFLDRLTGQFATDVTTASRTSLFNIQTLEWDIDLCALFGVPIEALPPIKPTMDDFGMIDGIGGPVPVKANVVDQQASLYGHGCRKEGDIKITFGTGAFVLAVTDTNPLETSDNGLLPTIAWQKPDAAPVYALDGGVYCASSALNWAKSLGLFTDFSDINSFSTRSAISRNLVFVPALTGLGCPHWDGAASGLWLGMSLDTTSQDMVQAILEGIAFRTAEVVHAISKQIPVGMRISIDGGMSSNPYFCQFLSTVLQKQIAVTSVSELTALGAAMMAMACDVTDTAITANERVYYPQASRRGDYQLFAQAVSVSQNWKR